MGPAPITSMPHLLLAVLTLLTGQAPLQISALKHAGGRENASRPFLVPLERESVPVRRKGVTVSHKTSYSGVISIGKPAQEFRMVFDTGSAHIVVPSSDCTNKTCIEHRRYNASKSASALAINVDGSSVPDDELCDQVTIGYGTGEITGEFVKEQVCPGSSTGGDDGALCMEVNVVMAVDMTPQPFRSFKFDGIFGLALDSLALSPDFSFFNSISHSASGAIPQFGVFLTGGEDGQQSEISLGGHNEQRLLTPLQWAPVHMPKLGYWQVRIKEVRIGGKPLEVCKSGTCRGIVDTGTSHMGVPGATMSKFMERLSVDTDQATTDCRDVAGPDLEIILEGEIALNMTPKSYMRPLSLEAGLSGGSRKSKVGAQAQLPPPAAAAGRSESQSLVAKATEPRTCAPRVMPVNLPALGPNVFILGEPFLHQYYTVYDWSERKIGFGLSASDANKRTMEEDGMTLSLIQVRLKFTVRARRPLNRLALPVVSSTVASEY